MLSYNEQIAICAQQENPFVQNKPYNPDHVFGWVVAHLLNGESPLTNEEAEQAKTLYTATIETLLKQDLPVTEANLIKAKEQIVGLSVELTKEVPTAKEDTLTVESSAKPAAAEQKTDAQAEEYFECSGLRVKKTWVKVAAIVILILLFIKLIK